MNECEWLIKEYIKRRFPSCVETPKEELFTEALWTLVDFFLQTEPMKQQEQVEWDDVNKRLQHHGFKPVFFADPAENKSPADLVLLDKKSAAELRTTLRVMLTDSERRQALIQELVMSNNQLKMEVQEHMSRAAQQCQRVTELEELLDEVKTRVQDLEDRYLSKAVQQHSHTQQLQKEKLEAHRRCEILEQKLSKQKEEATQLQRKLHFITKKEEQRLALQRQASQQRSPADQQANFLWSSPKQDGTAEISELISDPAKEAQLCVYYHHLLNEISAVVTDHKGPLRVHRPDFQDVLSTLKVWAEQLDLLKGLQCSLKELSVRLMPLQPCDGGYNTDEAAEVGDMLLLVDAMLENASADDKVLRSPTRHTLESMVSHFQKLFDVTSLRGVYPRMNEVYTKLGEMTNAMRNLRDILDLDGGVSPAEVVKHVSRLVSSIESMARFPELLGDIDIDSIIMKVKQHEEFFPAFHALVTGILQTLGVSHLDDILPALKALTETAQ